MLTAAITSAASSASPKRVDVDVVRAARRRRAAAAARRRRSTSRKPIASMNGRRSAASIGGRTAFRTAISAATRNAAPVRVERDPREHPRGDADGRRGDDPSDDQAHGVQPHPLGPPLEPFAVGVGDSHRPEGCQVRSPPGKRACNPAGSGARPLARATRDGQDGVSMESSHARTIAERLLAGVHEPGGTLLLAHVRRVAAAAPPEAQVVAWLHEVLETGNVSEQELLRTDCRATSCAPCACSPARAARTRTRRTWPTSS